MKSLAYLKALLIFGYTFLVVEVSLGFAGLSLGMAGKVVAFLLIPILLYAYLFELKGRSLVQEILNPPTAAKSEENSEQ